MAHVMALHRLFGGKDIITINSVTRKKLKGEDSYEIEGEFTNDPHTTGFVVQLDRPRAFALSLIDEDGEPVDLDAIDPFA